MLPDQVAEPVSERTDQAIGMKHAARAIAAVGRVANHVLEKGVSDLSILFGALADAAACAQKQVGDQMSQAFDALGQLGEGLMGSLLGGSMDEPGESLGFG